MSSNKLMNFRKVPGFPGIPPEHQSTTVKVDNRQKNNKKENNLQKITYRRTSRGNLLVDYVQG